MSAVAVTTLICGNFALVWLHLPVAALVVGYTALLGVGFLLFDHPLRPGRTPVASGAVARSIGLTLAETTRLVEGAWSPRGRA